MTPLLEVTGVTKRFPGVVALDGVDLDVESGEVHVLLGENGAGKSTLVKILSGVYQPDGGTVQLDGRPPRLSNPHDAQRAGISTIFQEFFLVPTLTVAENISLGREPTLAPGVLNRAALLRQAGAVLDSLSIRVDPGAPISGLRTAERQLVELAKALAVDARVLILDEPTAALNDDEVRRLFEVLRQLRTRGVGLIYISHRLEEVQLIGDRVTVLRDGRRVATVSAAGTRVADLIGMMVGRQLDDLYPRERVEPGAELLRVEGLDAPPAFREISLQARAGEVVGLAGLLGSGRSELGRALFGAYCYTAGRMVAFDAPYRPRSPADAIARGIGYLPPDRKGQALIPEASVQDNVTMSSLPLFRRWGVLSWRELGQLAARYIRELDIRPPFPRTPVKWLSGGNQQKVVLARALCRQSRFLIFDEPTYGVDIGARAEIYRLLNQVTAAGAGVLLISSDLPELLGMSDRILVMHAGRVVAEFDHDAATQALVLDAAFGKIGSRS